MAPRKVVIAVQLAILSVVITILIFYHDLIAERFTNVTKPLHHIEVPGSEDGSHPTSTIEDHFKEGTSGKNSNKTAPEPTMQVHQVLNSTVPFVKAIMNPADDEFPRLECPITDLSRYAVLNAEWTTVEYFFALDLRQCVDLLPRLLGSIVDAMKFLGPQSCSLSIVEGNSNDGTPEVLEAIRTEIEAIGATYSLQISDIDPSKNERIPKLAKLRNLALQPILDQASRYSLHTTVIFLNDVAICLEDILELIYQRQLLGADMTCAMDWTYVGQNPTFYDVWIARTLNGDSFFEIPADGNWDSAWNLFWNNPETKSRYNQHLPFQVFSCWNGAAVFTAAPIFQKAVAFRGPGKGECFQGEPELFCKDMWYIGYGRIAVVPSVNLEYSDERAKDIKALKGYTSHLLGSEQTKQSNPIIWQPNPPPQVKCMASYDSQEWRPWNETLARE